MNNSGQHTEEKLLMLVQQGDHEAFRYLFISYRNKLYTAAVAILGNPELAEDICQDTFLQVWLKRHTLTSIDNFSNWLFIIARNKMYDAVKLAAKNSTGRLEFLQNIAADSTPQDVTMQQKQLQELLDQAIAGLPERQQQAYRLTKQQGCSRDEAARRMGVSPETIKTHLENAVRYIRAYCLARLDRDSLLLLYFFYNNF